MDWIGILFFILVMVLRALGESEKQKKSRQARQQGKAAPVPPPKAAGSRRSGEGMPPVALPDLGLPPIFSFPLFEKAEEKPEPQTVEVSPPPRREYVEVQPLYREKAVVKSSRPEAAGTEKPPVPALQLNKAVEGIIWSEILQPPRALRPYGPPLARGRGRR